MTELPSGTVTFLFTDIEGSTPLWEQAPEAMRTAVALHHSLLRQAIESNGGVVFKIIGDAFQAAFPMAGQALQAALSAQHALQAASWPPQTGELWVRTGLHTGPAEIETSPSGADYAVSHTLNRVARIMSAGRGGQILLSRETAHLVERNLPPDVTLKDLGEYQLKGMAILEHLYQVSAPGLRNDFPPLSSGATPPNNLPAQLTSFIGRSGEMEVLHLMLTGEKKRLITLTGPGGTGKTRLALEVAAGLLTTFQDGIWLVELASLADPAMVPLAVLSALGLHETPGKSTVQRLIEHLRTKRLLLILDNCEHLVEEAAELAGQILQACPHLQILATSREILGTLGETPFRVPSLSLPASTGDSLEALARCEAIQLFMERASTVQPSFTLTEAHAPLVLRICQRLDGIPLAIELAAARIRMLNVEQIAARLDDSFRLLTGGSRTVLSRHQTLRALIDWSYNLLSSDEKALFIRLSVFAGGFTLEAVEHVCSDGSLFNGSERSFGKENTIDADAILDLLSQLVDKSLAIPMEGAGETEIRYRMLETIRQYARDKLQDAGSSASVRDRHLAYFLLMAEESEPYLRSANQLVWLDRLDTEIDNLRLALEWSQAGRVDEGLRLAAALLWFWHIRGHRQEGITWINHLLDASHKQVGVSSTPGHRMTRARALITTGFLNLFELQTANSLPMLQEAVDLLRELGPTGRHWLGVALLFLAKSQQDLQQRAQTMEEALPYLQEAGDLLYLAEYSLDKGGLLIDRNQLDAARASFTESMALREETHDLDGMGTAAMTLGDIALFQRDYAESQRQYEKSLACYQAVKNKTMESILLSRLGNSDLLTGHYEQAAGRFASGIAITQQTGDRMGMITSLFDLGRLDLNINEYRRASRHFSEIARIGAEIGSKQAVMVGTLFQGLAFLEAGDQEQVDFLTRQVIEVWQGMEKDLFSRSYSASMIELLAVLLVKRDPELAVRLFTTVDHSRLVTYELNTEGELATFQAARTTARQMLGEGRYTEIHAEGEPLSIEDALELIFQQVHIL